MAHFKWDTIKKGTVWFVFLLGVFGIAGIGVFSMTFFEESAEEDSWEELLKVSDIAVHSFDEQDVASLNGNREDLSAPTYERLRRRFLALGEPMRQSGVRWTYIMRKEGEGWIFLVDSVEEESPDHIVSGDVYTDYPKELNDVLDGRVVMTLGPYSDEWGEFVSTFIPIRDEKSGNIVGVFGADMDAAVWRKNLWNVRVLSGSTFGLILMMWFLLFAFRVRRLKAQKEIHFKELQLSSVAQNIQDVVYRVNAKGIITYISPAVETVLGISPNEIEGKSILNLFPPKERDAVLRSFEESFRSRYAGSMKVTLYKKDGTPVQTDIAGVFIHEGEEEMEFQGVIRDVTAEQRAGQRAMEQAQELRDSQKAILNVLEDVEAEKEKSEQEKEKINAILHSIGDGVFVVNRKLEIIMVNEVTARLSGYAREELSGQVYSEKMKFVRESDGAEVDAFVNDVIQTGETKEMANHTMLIQRDGNKIPVADSAAPLKNKNGEVIGCVVVFRDATKEREISKMKSEFVSVASHQLRTPLTGIKWFAELLAEEGSENLTAEQREYVGEIRKGNDRLIELVNDLLNVSRIETGKNFKVEPKVTDIVPLLRDAINDQAPGAKNKNISVSLDEEGVETLPLFIDGVKMSQVFQNLLSNAIKYSPDGGSVVVKCLDKGDYAVVSVRDSGIGIPLDQQGRVFEKFFRASNVLMTGAEGTGLGLYIAKSIVEAHGGKIWFESVGGKGTTFYIRLNKL